jgi:hypothetical protein
LESGVFKVTSSNTLNDSGAKAYSSPDILPSAFVTLSPAFRRINSVEELTTDSLTWNFPDFATGTPMFFSEVFEEIHPIKTKE